MDKQIFDKKKLLSDNLENDCLIAEEVNQS